MQGGLQARVAKSGAPLSQAEAQQPRASKQIAAITLQSRSPGYTPPVKWLHD